LLPNCWIDGRKDRRGNGGVWFEFVERHEMANTTSAKKATRKIARRTAVNKSRRSRVRGFIRKVEEAIASGDVAVAAEALKAAQPEIQRAATKGVLHSNTASRKVSRLAARVKALSA
jgi:small subunit ribosomal protein S20